MNAPLRLADVGIFQLIHAFQNVVKRMEAREDLREIFGEHFTVRRRSMSFSSESRTALRFGSRSCSATSPRVLRLVVTFLALLELIRLKQVRAIQRDPF